MLILKVFSNNNNDHLPAKLLKTVIKTVIKLSNLSSKLLETDITLLRTLIETIKLVIKTMKPVIKTITTVIKTIRNCHRNLLVSSISRLFSIHVTKSAPEKTNEKHYIICH